MRLNPHDANSFDIIQDDGKLKTTLRVSTTMDPNMRKSIQKEFREAMGMPAAQQTSALQNLGAAVQATAAQP